MRQQRQPASPSLLPAKRGALYYLRKDRFLYLLILPGLLYYVVFKYLPMFGIVIAFKDYQPFMGLEGIFSSEWVGLHHFKRFFMSQFSWQLIRNTLLISVLKLFWGFPAPIILALMLNEVRQRRFKKVVQTISYLPHFLSTVIVCGMIRTLTSTDGGLINLVLTLLGQEPIFFLGDTRYFRSILVISDIWQSVGWGSIVYLAAMTGIDTELYEAAEVDGASWLQKMWTITLPGIMPVVSIMLIFRVGNLLSGGFEQILLLYSPMVYSVADLISTYVYREGLVNMKYSFTTAIDLFTSLVAMILVLGTNWLAKKAGQEGIW
ncbi:ABC transporter permease subunit [Ruminococcaceae bacterium OttesenSCG-928-L11]|nr:ABC transporter permease subunit [Ruminococcaceae bacterium OttesenSCG-928-L11]